jgi:hypothetical protein
MVVQRGKAVKTAISDLAKSLLVGCLKIYTFEMKNAYQTVWFHGSGPVRAKDQSKSETVTYGTVMLWTFVMTLDLVARKGASSATRRLFRLCHA